MVAQAARTSRPSFAAASHGPVLRQDYTLDTLKAYLDEQPGAGHDDLHKYTPVQEKQYPSSVVKYEHIGAFADGQWSCCSSETRTSRGCRKLVHSLKRWVYDSPL